MPRSPKRRIMETNIIHTGDSAEILKTFPDDCIDLTVTSPPYDNLREYKGFTFDFETIAHELYRVTKPGGVVVWVVGDATVNGSETGTSFRQALYFMENSGQTVTDIINEIPRGFNLHDTMIYQKSGCSMPNKNRYFQSFEYMFVFSKGQPKSVNFILDRKNRFRERWGKARKARNKDGTSGKEYKSKKAPEFGRRFNIWKYTQGGGYESDDAIAYKHPAIFPEALARDHILSWSNPGDIVLDPFFGSGTTGKQAKLLSRPYIGIEISPEYVELAEKRILSANVPLF